MTTRLIGHSQKPTRTMESKSELRRIASPCQGRYDLRPHKNNERKVGVNVASITSESNGRRVIQFVGRDGKRRSIRLGKCPQRVAEAVKVRVEQLNASAISSHAVDAETSRWLASIDKKLTDKLAKVGLVAKREAATLDQFLMAYLATRTDIKPRTLNNLEQTQGWLVEFFGANRRLADITAGDGDEWRVWLLTKVGENTARRHCGRAKQFFRAAVRKRLADANPFGDMKGCSVRANKSRDYFVSLDDAYKVLEACPDANWRLLFALSRFGGLRCPSEHVALTWADVDWELDRLTIRSPKTEHHEGKESRIVPIFPELRPYLETVRDDVSEMGEHVIAIPSLRRDRYANVGTMMAKIVRRAGLKPWPKLFHNCRATRETELAQQYPMHVVCEWIGNSQPVALKHYLRVTDADYTRAASSPTPTPAKLGGKSGAEAGAVTAQDAVQNMVQQPAAVVGKTTQEMQKALANQGLEQKLAVFSYAVENFLLPPRGFEPLLPD